MVLSCLVEPLVQPLVGRGTRGPGRRTALSRSRLASTALAMSALLAVATSADASDLLEGRTAPEAEQVQRNAHAKPAPIPYRVVLEQFTAARREDDHLVAQPGLAPEFEWDAVLAHRLRHSRDIVRDIGPGLGLGRRLDRLLSSAQLTFHLFASGQHQSGAPNPVS